MNEYIKKAVEKAASIFAATEEALNNDWDRKENLQFPNLLASVVTRLKVDPKHASDVDLYMRNFVREHPAYFVSRGAKGGIMLRSVYEARLEKKAKLEQAKKEFQAKVKVKLETSVKSVKDSSTKKATEVTLASNDSVTSETEVSDIDLLDLTFSEPELSDMSELSDVSEAFDL